MVTGSDHGVRHVIQSNVKHTLNALDSEQLNGLVSPKDKLMAMQIMIDHDLGYTTDAAKGNFDAAKDHPLASTAYMELGGQASNVFTPEEQAYMRDAVLKHSYPFNLDQPLDFANNKGQAIADLVSVIDAMGVTGDTKCPALYREVLSQEDVERLAKSTTTDEKAVLAELHGIVDQAVKDGKISQDTAEGYHMALDYDASQWGAKNMILQQFGGKLVGTDMEPSGEGHALHITFGVSEEMKHISTLFGDGVALNAFNKMVGDLPFKPTVAEKKAAEAARAAEEARNVPEDKQTKLPTVTNLGQRAKDAEAGTPQDLTTGGAVRITLRKLQE